MDQPGVRCSLPIHPMHVESVAWIAERKDVLYAFFFFLSLISYILYLDKKKYGWLAACLGAFVLSLAAKPAAVILPLVLLAIDYFRSRKVKRGNARRKGSVLHSFGLFRLPYYTGTKSKWCR